jgi:hypothetical protein
MIERLGITKQLSIMDFEPDQRLVDEALGLGPDVNKGTQQGGAGVTGNSSMRPFSAESAGNGGAVPFGQHPRT